VTVLEQFFDQDLPDRVTAETRDIHFGRLLATVLAGFFYLIGWLTARTFRITWFALAWSATAVRVGWREGFAQPTAHATQ
jgi:hypothetical protein